MTNTLDTQTIESLRLAAERVESGFPLTADQSDFLAFLLRTIAHGRDLETVRYRAGQLARCFRSTVEDDADEVRRILRKYSAHGDFSLVSLVKGLRQDFGAVSTFADYDNRTERLRAVAVLWRVPDLSPDAGNLLICKRLVESWLANR